MCLTQQARQRGNIDQAWQYSLPTEAQWEYAYRAGKTSHYYWGNTFLNGENCNAENDSSVGSKENGAVSKFRNKGWPVKSTMTVGRFPPNPWNLYDMNGNVWEWCRDVYSTNYQTQTVNPCINYGESGKRVRKGGSYGSSWKQCRGSYRENRNPMDPSKFVGFRVVLAPTVH